MLNIFLSENIGLFLAGGGVEPPNLKADMSAKKSSFFDALPNTFYRSKLYTKPVTNEINFLHFLS